MGNKVKVIKCGKLIDGTGRTPVDDAVIVIEDSKISIVCMADEFKTPGDAEIIDARGKTVMPGLIDTHVHLAGVINQNEKHSTFAMLKAPSPMLTLYAARWARDTIRGGITTIRDMGGYTNKSNIEIICLRNAINLGLHIGPRILVAGWVGMTGGHYDDLLPITFIREPEENADGPWEIRKLVRKLRRQGINLIKTATDGHFGYNYTHEEIKAVVDEAHSLGMRVAVHVGRLPSIKAALAAGVDTIEHGTDLDDETMKIMIEKNVVLVPTLMIYSERVFEGRLQMGEYSENQLERFKIREKDSAQMLQKAYKMGVKIAMGTDMHRKYPPAPQHGENAYELELMVKYGVTERDAIVAATKISAKALGLENRIGTLETGKLADIIILNGDPLKDITVLQDKEKMMMVLKGGKVILSRDV